MTLDARPTPRITPQLVVGLGIVIIGLLLTAGNLGWLRTRDYVAYWPLVIVAGGLTKVFNSQSTAGRVTGGIFTFVGAWWVLDNLGVVHTSVADWWPLVFVFLGVRVIFGARPRPRVILRPRSGEVTSVAAPEGGATDDFVHGFAFWSAIRRRIVSSAFRGADLTAVMGGVELDLRGATAANGEAVIDVFAMWGGIEIRVPPDWSVSNQATAIMGGVEDKSTATADARQRLVVRGFVLMGGVEVKT